MANISIYNNKSEISKTIVKYLVDSINKKPNTNIGIATGSTFMETYKLFSDTVKKNKINVSKIKLFALDEYLGIDKNDKNSYYTFIKEKLGKPLNLSEKQIFTPDNNPKNYQKSPEKYEESIKKYGGIDIQFLGIGTDGHIGFNEPGSTLFGKTRIKTLTISTLVDNSKFFINKNVTEKNIHKYTFSAFDKKIKEQLIPIHAITQGVGTILKAKKIILVALGKNKSDAIGNAFEGGISSFCPASALQLHTNVSVLLDNESSKKLKNKKYYIFANKNKPKWQSEL